MTAITLTPKTGDTDRIAYDRTTSGESLTLIRVQKDTGAVYQVGLGTGGTVKVSPYLSLAGAFDVYYLTRETGVMVDDNGGTVGTPAPFDPDRLVDVVPTQTVDVPATPDPVYYMPERRRWTKAEAARYPGAIAAAVGFKLAAAGNKKVVSYQRHDPLMSYQPDEGTEIDVFAPDGRLLSLTTATQSNLSGGSVVAGSTLLPAGTWVIELHKDYGPFWVRLIEVK